MGTEETFLAAKSFDYLGCHLIHNGIKPQEKKIDAILNTSQPTNLRELRRLIEIFFAEEVTSYIL